MEIDIKSELSRLASVPNHTGENPFYVPEENALYWVDIPRGTLFGAGLEMPTGRMFRLDLARQAPELIYEGIPIGGFTRQQNGDWLLFRVRDIARMTPQGEVESLLPLQDAGAKRFNDVIADPRGRVFAGTIGNSDESGALYRLERNGSLQLLFRGTGISNGMGFSPDGRHFYWTDYTRRRIFRFAYEPASGEISARELFYEAAPGDGQPDGMTLDTQGQIWSAHHGTGWLIALSPQGREVQRLQIPARRLTSLTFGGPRWGTLFLTTGRQSGSSFPDGQPDGEDDGALFALPGVAVGTPEFASRVLI